MNEHAHGVIIIVISQINLLLSLVNDILDLKLIEEGHFEPKMERFQPKNAVNFIKKMLECQGELSNTKIEVDYIAVDAKSNIDRDQVGSDSLLLPS